MNTMTYRHDDPSERLPLRDLAKQLASDGLDLARSEVRLAKMRAAPEFNAAALVVALVGGGALLGLLALIAFTIGLVGALTPHLGSGVAGLVVGGGDLVVGALLAWIGLRHAATLLSRIRSMMA